MDYLVSCKTIKVQQKSFFYKKGKCWKKKYLKKIFRKNYRKLKNDYFYTGISEFKPCLQVSNTFFWLCSPSSVRSL